MNRIAHCEQVGHFLSDLAEVILSRVLQHMRDEFSASYGHIQGSELALVGMGKLGARELTFASDLDLIFVYHSPWPTSFPTESAHFRPVSISTVYASG